jgi:hypothetical protein
MEGIRRRNIPTTGSSSGGILSSLKEYDAYAKPLEDFRVKTATGASGKVVSLNHLVTIISAIIIFILLSSEFADWLRVDMVPSLAVDKGRKEKMQININMTFPKIPCFCKICWE